MHNWCIKNTVFEHMYYEKKWLIPSRQLVPGWGRGGPVAGWGMKALGLWRLGEVKAPAVVEVLVVGLVFSELDLREADLGGLWVLRPVLQAIHVGMWSAGVHGVDLVGGGLVDVGSSGAELRFASVGGSAGDEVTFDDGGYISVGADDLQQRLCTLVEETEGREVSVLEPRTLPAAGGSWQGLEVPEVDVGWDVRLGPNAASGSCSLGCGDAGGGRGRPGVHGVFPWYVWAAFGLLGLGPASAEAWPSSVAVLVAQLAVVLGRDALDAFLNTYNASVRSAALRTDGSMLVAADGVAEALAIVALLRRRCRWLGEGPRTLTRLGSLVGVQGPTALGLALGHPVVFWCSIFSVALSSSRGSGIFLLALVMVLVLWVPQRGGVCVITGTALLTRGSSSLFNKFSIHRWNSEVR